jgi:hypothetical protein
MANLRIRIVIIFCVLFFCIKRLLSQRETCQIDGYVFSCFFPQKNILCNLETLNNTAILLPFPNITAVIKKKDSPYNISVHSGKFDSLPPKILNNLIINRADLSRNQLRELHFNSFDQNISIINLTLK